MLKKKRNLIISLVLVALALMSFGKKPNGTVEVGEGEFGEPETDGELPRENSGESNSGGQTRVDPEPTEEPKEYVEDYDEDYEGTKYGSGGTRTRSIKESIQDVDLVSVVIPEPITSVDRVVEYRRVRTQTLRAVDDGSGCITCR